MAAFRLGVAGSWMNPWWGHGPRGAHVNYSALTTGQLDFKQFANAVLDDLTRILVRLLVVQSLSALGGATGIIPPLPGRQEGGPVRPGRSFVVGENGPEILTMGNQGGFITPNPADMPAPQVDNHNSVVVVTDPNDIPSAIEEGAAADALVVAISRQSNRINRALGNS